jgi:hypothetical protein
MSRFNSCFENPPRFNVYRRLEGGLVPNKIPKLVQVFSAQRHLCHPLSYHPEGALVTDGSCNYGWWLLSTRFFLVGKNASSSE